MKATFLTKTGHVCTTNELSVMHYDLIRFDLAQLLKISNSSIHLSYRSVLDLCLVSLSWQERPSPVQIYQKLRGRYNSLNVAMPLLLLIFDGRKLIFWHL